MIKTSLLEQKLSAPPQFLMPFFPACAENGGCSRETCHYTQKRVFLVLLNLWGVSRGYNSICGKLLGLHNDRYCKVTVVIVSLLWSLRQAADLYVTDSLQRFSNSADDLSTAFTTVMHKNCQSCPSEMNFSRREDHKPSCFISGTSTLITLCMM